MLADRDSVGLPLLLAVLAVLVLVLLGEVVLLRAAARCWLPLSGSNRLLLSPPPVPETKPTP